MPASPAPAVPPAPPTEAEVDEILTGNAPAMPDEPADHAEPEVTGADLMPWYLQPGKLVDLVKALLGQNGNYNPIPNGEAGFSDTYRLVDPDGIEHQLTFRGERAEDWPYVLQQSANARRMLLHESSQATRWDVGHAFKSNPVQSVPVGNGAGPALSPAPVRPAGAAPIGVHTAPPVPGGAKPAPTNVPVSGPEDPGAAPDGRGNVPGQKFEVLVSKITVTPNAKGKTDVKFFPYLANGKVGDWPETNDDRKTAAEWAAEFQQIHPDWQPEHFAVAGEYPINGQFAVIVEIANKKSSKGNYYKNYSGVVVPSAPST